MAGRNEIETRETEAASGVESPRTRLPFPIWIATAGGAGFAPVAPGTAGALVGVLLFLGLAGVGLPLYVLTVAALSCLGVWASDCAERHFDRHDDGRIVIDEVAGQLLTFLPLVALRDLPLGSWPLTARTDWPTEVGAFSALVVTGFVAFRVFDIWKPGPVRWAERYFEGGVGVMADDLVAGGIGALVLLIPTHGVVVARLGELLGGTS